MTYAGSELQFQNYLGANEDQNASAVASTLITATEVLKYKTFSVQLENNDGAETVTAIVWRSSDG